MPLDHTGLRFPETKVVTGKYLSEFVVFSHFTLIDGCLTNFFKAACIVQLFVVVYSTTHTLVTRQKKLLYLPMVKAMGMPKFSSICPFMCSCSSSDSRESLFT
jgi:hypothetical protein